MKIYNLKKTKALTFPQIVLSIVVGVLLAPLLIILSGKIRWLKNYCKALDYTPTKLPEDYASRARLIAHRGYRALAPENTLPAYDEAGKAKFWGAENDIHRTKDGVWVLHHDYLTYRMMNKNYWIEKTNYKTLMKACYDNGSSIKDYPNLHITRLEDYLQKCKDYGMIAIIEIKGKCSVDYLDEVVDMVKEYGVEAQYISFAYESVKKMRELCDAKLFYLTYKIDDNAIEKAKSISNCGVSFDANDDYNKSQESVNKILDAGLEPALWAVDDLELCKNYIDWGVKNITTNQIHY